MHGDNNLSTIQMEICSEVTIFIFQRKHDWLDDFSNALKLIFMASEQFIFSIYKTSDDSRYFVLRTVLPDFNNISQSDEDESWEIESKQRAELLKFITDRENCSGFEQIGELHGFPIGAIFYSEFGQSEVPVYYMETDFGKPWIVFGTADSEGEFLTELTDDDDLQALNPIGKPIKIDVCFVTPNDFNFN